MPASLKPGVSWAGLNPAGQRIHAALDRLADTFACAVVATCTTGSHGPDDPHTKGQAIDVRTVGWTPTNAVTYYKWLVNELGPDFYCQLEAPITPKDAELAKVVVVNKAATAPHLHIQLRKFHTYTKQETV